MLGVASGFITEKFKQTDYFIFFEESNLTRTDEKAYEVFKNVERIFKGGSWNNYSYFCKSYLRNQLNLGWRSLNLGFRSCG